MGRKNIPYAFVAQRCDWVKCICSYHKKAWLLLHYTASTMISHSDSRSNQGTASQGSLCTLLVLLYLSNLSEVALLTGPHVLSRILEKLHYPMLIGIRKPWPWLICSFCVHLKGCHLPGADGHHAYTKVRVFSTMPFQSWLPGFLKLPWGQSYKISTKWEFQLRPLTLFTGLKWNLKEFGLGSIQRNQWKFSFFSSLGHCLHPVHLSSSLICIKRDDKYWEKRHGLLPTPGNWQSC